MAGMDLTALGPLMEVWAAPKNSELWPNQAVVSAVTMAVAVAVAVVVRQVAAQALKGRVRAAMAG